MIRSRAVLIDAGNVKVDEPNAAVGAHNDVLRLDVAVDHGRLLPVEIDQNVAELQADGDDLIARERPFGGIDVQRRALDIVAHDNEHRAALKARRDGGQPRVGKPRQHPGVGREGVGGLVIAFRREQLPAVLLPDEERLPAAVRSQTFQLVIARQKLLRVTVFVKGGLDVRHHAFGVTHAYVLLPAEGVPNLEE